MNNPGTVEWAHAIIARYEPQISGPGADITKVHEAPYIEAAAIISIEDAARYERLKGILKGRGLSVGNWERRVRETEHKIRNERKAEQRRQAQAQQQASTQQARSGSALNLTDPTPADQPVDGALLAQALADTIRRFVKLSQEAVHAIVLWILFTYLIEAFDYAPRLAIWSPEMRCGKSTLVEVISHLVRRSLPCSNISPSAIYRTIETVHPTLLMDEMDSYLRTNNEAGEEMRGILNSGHSRALAFVVRLVPVRQGDFEPRKYSTFTPIVQSLIGKLPPTLADRSIAIAMKRKLPGDKVQRIGGKNRTSNINLFEDMRRRLARWTADNRNRIAQAEPAIPEWLDDRQANNWSALLPIADAISTGWGELARKAAKQLSGAIDEVGNGILLLRDLQGIFTTVEEPKDPVDLKQLPSAIICQRLEGMEDRPWPEYDRRNRKPISQTQLAYLLKPFEVYPLNLRTAAGIKKGYKLDTTLKDAFSRYCQGNDVAGRDAVTTAGAVGESDDSASATEEKCSGSQNGSNPLGENECSGVADENRKTGDGGYVEPDEEAEIDRLAGADGWQKQSRPERCTCCHTADEHVPGMCECTKCDCSSMYRQIYGGRDGR